MRFYLLIHFMKIPHIFYASQALSVQCILHYVSSACCLNCMKMILGGMQSMANTGRTLLTQVVNPKPSDLKICQLSGLVTRWSAHQMTQYWGQTKHNGRQCMQMVTRVVSISVPPPKPCLLTGDCRGKLGAVYYWKCWGKVRQKDVNMIIIDVHL